jgi:hypothetical protein
MGKITREMLAFELEYYDENGTLVNRVDYSYPCKINLATKKPIMGNIYAHLRGIINSGGQGPLPGCHDWEPDQKPFSGYVRITCKNNRYIAPKLLKVSQF